MTDEKKKTASPEIKARIDHLMNSNSKIKAYASVTIEDAFAIHNIKIMKSEKGCFISMPQESVRLCGKTQVCDIFHAITAEARNRLTKVVMDAYRCTLKEHSQEQIDAPYSVAETPFSSEKRPNAEQGQPFKRCRIWQLKKVVDVAMRFINYENTVNKFGEPNKKNYTQVFDGNLGTNDLEQIYSICRDNPPSDYRGYKMAISDVVELYDDSSSYFFYCDSVGFRPIHFYQPQNPEAK